MQKYRWYVQCIEIIVHIFCGLYVRLDVAGSFSQCLKKVGQKKKRKVKWLRGLTTSLLCQDTELGGIWFEHAAFKSVPWLHNALGGNPINVSQGFNWGLGGRITREIGLTWERKLKAQQQRTNHFRSTQMVHREIQWKDATFKLHKLYGNKRSKIVVN